MSSPFAAEGTWHPLDYDEAWVPFNERMHFRADYHERSTPAITLPRDSLVIDLEPVFAQEGPRFAAGEAAVNASALRAFVWLADGGDLTALDWQHTPYRYSPAAHALSSLDHWPVPVFPNGDYYAHLAPGLEWGTFGHPWQQTLTLWGSALVESLGAELLTWLPKHPQSRSRRSTSSYAAVGAERPTCCANRTSPRRASSLANWPERTMPGPANRG